MERNKKLKPKKRPIEGKLIQDTRYWCIYRLFLSYIFGLWIHDTYTVIAKNEERKKQKNNETKDTNVDFKNIDEIVEYQYEEISTESNKSKRGSAVIACDRFEEAHTFERTVELLKSIFARFNISNDEIVAVVTDNGSNFVKVFKEFGVEISIMDVNDAELKETEEDEDCGTIDIDLDFSLPESDIVENADKAVNENNNNNDHLQRVRVRSFLTPEDVPFYHINFRNIG